MIPFAYHNLQAPSHVTAMVDKFISENQARILNHCFAQDVDHTGTLSVNQVTKALWDSGLDVDKVNKMLWHKCKFQEFVFISDIM